jgi:ribosomal protein L25 (general stress protein Ctc)
MELQVQERNVTGKKVKSLRKEGLVPGIVYGKHMTASTSIQFDKIAFIKVYKAA